MRFIVSTLTITVALFLAMLALLEVGRRLGLRRLERDGEEERPASPQSRARRSP